MFEVEDFCRIIEEETGAIRRGQKEDGTILFEGDTYWIHVVTNPDSFLAQCYPQSKIPWAFYAHKWKETPIAMMLNTNKEEAEYWEPQNVN